MRSQWFPAKRAAIVRARVYPSSFRSAPHNLPRPALADHVLARQLLDVPPVEFTADLGVAAVVKAQGMTPRTISAYDTGASPVPRYIALASKGGEAERRRPS